MLRTENYVAPTWPEPGQLQQMHLVSRSHLSDAVVNAVMLGATETDHLPKPDLFRVLLDPAGQPFCLPTVSLD